MLGYEYDDQDPSMYSLLVFNQVWQKTDLLLMPFKYIFHHFERVSKEFPFEISLCLPNKSLYGDV